VSKSNISANFSKIVSLPGVMRARIRVTQACRRDRTGSRPITMNHNESHRITLDRPARASSFTGTSFTGIESGPGIELRASPERGQAFGFESGTVEARFFRHRRVCAGARAPSAARDPGLFYLLFSGVSGKPRRSGNKPGANTQIGRCWPVFHLDGIEFSRMSSIFPARPPGSETNRAEFRR